VVSHEILPTFTKQVAGWLNKLLTSESFHFRKNYDGQTVPTDNIPAALVFRKDPNGDKAHTM
jgi:hypothetical protein